MVRCNLHVAGFACWVCLLSGGELASVRAGQKASGPNDIHVWVWPDTGTERRSRGPWYGLMAGDLLRLDSAGRCGRFEGIAEPGKFFDGLKRFDTPQGPAFRNGRRVVTEFPDKISLFISVCSSACSEHDKNPVRWGPVPPDFLKSPQMQGLALRGLEQRPLEIGLVEEGVRGPRGPGFAQFWAYKYVVKTKGIPLTDILVFTLHSVDGRKLSHFTLRL